ncbi:MAG: DNA integrity scanning protein DisA nucleotide-binding domain protein [Pirellulales bacterium]|nr:DNA integrity scanning protein DisA nucleotide-binding domain protein [Pirellulales bacterium]
MRPEPADSPAKPLRFTEQFELFFELAARIVREVEADGALLLLEGRVDWPRLRKLSERHLAGVKLVVAATSPDHLEGHEEAPLARVLIDMPDAPVYDKLSQALLECVADDLLAPGAKVLALYGGFEPGAIDSMSVIALDDRLGRLTVRDLRRLETSVPLETLQTVVNLALEIGHEGREGKPVGTLFVVGDTRKVLSRSRAAGFDPVKGYSRKDRNLKSARVREGIKEIAQMDGAIVVAPDGTVEAASRYLDAPATNITLSKGLGARHWAAAAITRATKAVAVAVSESSGTVRIFQDGEVVLRIEPFRRPMKWKDFEYEPPVGE